MIKNRQFQIILSAIVFWSFYVQVVGSGLAEEGNQTAFINANLIPMTIETVIPNQTVVVEKDRIKVVGPSSQIKIPANTRVIDCRGAFLLPGLADMHMHFRPNVLSDAWPVSPLKLYLANGVTTIRCFGPRGKTGRYVLTWRDKIESGELDGPSILACGPQLRGHFREPPDLIVIRQKFQHFDFIKIYSFVTRQEYHTIMSTAQKCNIYTAGHIPFQVGLDGVLAEGMDEVAHVEELLWEFVNLDRQRYFESEDEWMTWVIQTAFIQLAPFLEYTSSETERKIEAMLTPVVDKLKDKPIPFCTTLVVDDVIVRKLFDPDGFLRRPENRYLPSGYLELFRKGLDKHQMQFKGGEAFARFKYMLDRKLLEALKKNGIPLLLATDAGSGTMGIVPGFSLHDELRILVENGFTPYEALASGTSVSSKIVQRMNGKDDFGTIEQGKRADLLLLAKNPLDDIANARNVLGVMAAGRWYDQEALAEMLVKKISLEQKSQ